MGHSIIVSAIVSTLSYEHLYVLLAYGILLYLPSKTIKGRAFILARARILLSFDTVKQ